ncbi:unnamed protein product [Discosporangium mesarthrocarpum]
MAKLGEELLPSDASKHGEEVISGEGEVEAGTPAGWAEEEGVRTEEPAQRMGNAADPLEVSEAEEQAAVGGATEVSCPVLEGGEVVAEQEVEGAGQKCQVSDRHGGGANDWGSGGLSGSGPLNGPLELLVGNFAPAAGVVSQEMVRFVDRGGDEGVGQRSGDGEDK